MFTLSEARVFHRIGAAVLLTGLVVGGTACELFTGPDGPEPETGALPAIPAVDLAQIPSEVRDAHWTDAARMALRRRIEDGPAPGRRSVEFRSAEVEPFFHALLRVYLFDHAAGDSVVRIREIHTFRQPRVHSLAVAVDTSADWADAWREGRRFTGNGAIDDLVRTFGLSLSRFHDFRTMPYDLASLRSETPLDIAALAARFQGLDGVRFAEQNGVVGDGNDIQAIPEEAAIRLDYSAGFGDCPAGCVGRHIWSFRVHESGEVEFVGSSGDPLP